MGIFQSAALGRGSEIVQVFMVMMAEMDLVQFIHGPIHMGGRVSLSRSYGCFDSGVMIWFCGDHALFALEFSTATSYLRQV